MCSIMKTRSIILAVAFLIGGSIACSLQAQKHLDALIKKCESMRNVDVQVIITKDKKTRKVEHSIKNISFSMKENPQLFNDFIEAFRADQDEAYKVTDRSVNGKVYPSYYRFDNGKTDIMFTANFDEDKRNGTSEVVIVRIERPSDGDSSYEMNTNGIRYYGKNLDFDSGNFNEHMAEYNARMAELGKRMAEFGKRMENSSKEIADGNVIIVRPDTIQWADSTTQHENAIIK